MTSFGFPRRHYRVTDSTNERARELARAGAPSGTVVTAEAQTAGRGRRGRRWAAAPGEALLYSAILGSPDRGLRLLPLAVAVAVCDAIESLAAVECQIKWPNDVWIEGEKVAGVLIEGRFPDWTVIGIGVNVAGEPAAPGARLRWPATALGRGVAVERLRRELDNALSHWVGASGEQVLAVFRERDALSGRTVAWEDGSLRSGTAAGIDEMGNLVVAVPGGGRAVLGAGEVSLVLG